MEARRSCNGKSSSRASSLPAPAFTGEYDLAALLEAKSKMIQRLSAEWVIHYADE
jgi:hypothetical protein